MSQCLRSLEIEFIADRRFELV
ncbi:unnamed protein product [Calypogeia fissa]